MKRKGLLLLIISFVMLGNTSCKTLSPSTAHLFFPSEETPSLHEVAKEVSKAVGIPISQRDNIGLYAFIADWLSTPYRYGRATIKGTDCSGFVYNLYKEVYHDKIPRTSASGLCSTSERINRKDLREGDLVFFNINNRTGGRASHVGVYLRNGLFVHASVHKGVTISSLSDPYYAAHYLSAGRLLPANQIKDNNKDYANSTS